ncbi:hypothetical protein OCB15_18035 [Bacillus cereus]|nr:hypothetical protein [Bacillus cereus]
MTDTIKVVGKVVLTVGIAFGGFTACMKVEASNNIEDTKEETIIYTVDAATDTILTGIDKEDGGVVLYKDREDTKNLEKGDVIAVTYGSAHDDIKSVEVVDDVR